MSDPKEDLVEDTGAPAAFDFGKKKKKKPKKSETSANNEEEKVEEKPTVEEKEEEAPAQQATTGKAPSSQEIGGYTYDQLAARIFDLITSSRPEEKVVYKMKPPVVYKDGTKKTVWVNFPEICRM
jgi:translation initiation factor 2 subunit 2